MVPKACNVPPIDQPDSKVRAYDEFLALLSHEVRSPLNAMVGWLEVLQSRNSTAATSARALQGLDSSIGRQRRLAQELLYAIPILAGRVKLVSVAVDLAELLPRIAQRTRTRTQVVERSISIRVESIEPTLSVLADMQTLEEVLVYLVEAAIYRTTPESTIAFAARRVGDLVEIELAGSDAAASTAPFSRLRGNSADNDDRANPAYLGPGLGLAIAKSLIELNQGELHIGSRQNGADFSLTARLRSAVLAEREPVFVDPLAIDALAADTLASEHSARRPLAGAAMLLLDGRAAIDGDLAGRLGRFGAQVTRAAAERVLLKCYPNWARAGGERLLIVSLATPDAASLAFILNLRRLESELGLPRVPAVAIAAAAGGYSQRLALSAGFDVFIREPIAAESLLAALAPLLGR